MDILREFLVSIGIEREDISLAENVKFNRENCLDVVFCEVLRLKFVNINMKVFYSYRCINGRY